MIEEQFTFYLENKPTVLARMARALADQGVNIEGISVAESADAALVQIIVCNASKAKKALQKAKITHSSEKVSVVVLDHKPGSLSAFISRLAKEKVNINYMYGTALADSGKCRVVISAEDLKKVEEIAGR